MRFVVIKYPVISKESIAHIDIPDEYFHDGYVNEKGREFVEENLPLISGLDIVLDSFLLARSKGRSYSVAVTYGAVTITPLTEQQEQLIDSRIYDEHD